MNRHNINRKKSTKGTTAYLLLCFGAGEVEYRLLVVSVDMSLGSFLEPIEGFDRINRFGIHRMGV